MIWSLLVYYISLSAFYIIVFHYFPVTTSLLSLTFSRLQGLFSSDSLFQSTASRDTRSEIVNEGFTAEFTQVLHKEDLSSVVDRKPEFPFVSICHCRSP